MTHAALAILPNDPPVPAALPTPAPDVATPVATPAATTPTLVAFDPGPAPLGWQDCARCSNAPQCWGSTKPNARMLNLLVCRLKRDIAPGPTVQLIFRLLAPKFRRMALWINGPGKSDTQDLVHELESRAYEGLRCDYEMGHRVPPLVFLFHRQHGYLTHWALQYIQRNKVQQERAMLRYDSSDANRLQDFEQRLNYLNVLATRLWVHQLPPWLIHDPRSDGEEPMTSRAHKIRRTLEDGLTLTTLEYRVIKYMLLRMQNGDTRRRGLQLELAESLGVSRTTIADAYALAARKFIAALGLRERYLEGIGIDAPSQKQQGRRRARRLSPDELAQLLSQLDQLDEKATILDLAWAFGLTKMALFQIRQRRAAGAAVGAAVGVGGEA